MGPEDFRFRQMTEKINQAYDRKPSTTWLQIFPGGHCKFRNKAASVYSHTKLYSYCLLKILYLPLRKKHSLSRFFLNLTKGYIILDR